MKHAPRIPDVSSFRKTGNTQTRKNSSCGNTAPVPGDVWWVDNMKFNDGINGKGRPIHIVGMKGDTVLYRKCTSQTTGSNRRRLMVQDEISAGLDKCTYIDMEVLTVNRNRLQRRLGHLSDCDIDLIS